MIKSILLLLAALCLTQLALASPDYYIKIYNNDKSRGKTLEVLYGARQCYCIVDTQTAEIDARYAGMDTKLFRTTDCTGNWADGTGKITKNAQWSNTMNKLALLFAALCFIQQMAYAWDFYTVYVENKEKTKYASFYSERYERLCYCVRDTSTYRIDGDRGGDVKLFSTTDCTGNYAAGTKENINAQWVKSISFGKSGISSKKESSKCDWDN
ncbi:hypothetical protein BGZ73_007762 [Actinomortierella ambigua]|nr:hypothetical protein BGZ73_007762 [Actinomortierella ambigua]